MACFVTAASNEGRSGANKIAGPGHNAFEGDAVALGLLLYALGLEIVDNDPGKISAGEIGVGGRAIAVGGVDRIDQLLLAGGEDAVR
jgi:hypothetical protein